jgi:site-specific DNA-cytosine methylase
VSQTLDAVLHKKQAMPEKNRFPVLQVPAWVQCPDCDECICQLHGVHVEECDCPPIDAWAESDLWPYEPSVLRYITPTEAERLQGFPDDWTAVPHRGKPAADGPRYKAIGNSMATPVMRWIGERIAAIHQATEAK